MNGRIYRERNEETGISTLTITSDRASALDAIASYAELILKEPECGTCLSCRYMSLSEKDEPCRSCGDYGEWEPREEEEEDDESD